MENKMGILKMKRLIWSMGLPMVVSMVLQAIYNIVDTAFVINMEEYGSEGNLALTYAFPIQLLIIAIGVGTGVGINALLSKKLGEGDRESAGRIAGNGIFLSLVIYVVFLLFGLFGASAFISIQAKDNPKVVEMGTSYLMICSCLSFGVIGFAVYERFLQATGKTMFSTIAQITGALLNIVLDYVFIYPCHMGIEGAAYATIIGQIASLLIAMLLHYTKNKEISGNIKYSKPSWTIIKGIYKIGIPAAVMQGLLSVMMLSMNMILGTSAYNRELLQGSYGIYYKIQQFALFAAFGLSNTIISVVSFNYGLKDMKRVKEGIKYGILDSVVICLAITILFQILARPISNLFGMASGGGTEDVINVCTTAMHIATLGYVFMGISVGIQGVLQAFRQSVCPMIISFLRLIIFVLPIAYLFTLSQDSITLIWWTFPIAEALTAGISVIFLRKSVKKLGTEETK